MTTQTAERFSAGTITDSMPGVRFFRDFDRAVSRLYGVIKETGQEVRYRPMTLVLDPRLRVIAMIPIDPAIGIRITCCPNSSSGSISEL